MPLYCGILLAFTQDYDIIFEEMKQTGVKIEDVTDPDDPQII